MSDAQRTVMVSPQRDDCGFRCDWRTFTNGRRVPCRKRVAYSLRWRTTPTAMSTVRWYCREHTWLRAEQETDNWNAAP